MAYLKTFKPTTPSLRGTKIVATELRDKPLKSLTKGRKRISGRSSQGRISMRRRGGAHKRLFREILRSYEKVWEIPGTVTSLQYDPNRSANIALVTYVNGFKAYVLAAKGMQVGDKLLAADRPALTTGNRLPLKNIPVGKQVYDVEFYPMSFSHVVKSAGTSATIIAKDRGMVTLKLPSGEWRLFSEKCLACFGEVGNELHSATMIGKAGRNRWLGHRPKQRGVSMNPVDHPHGGGEGKTSGGRHPVSPWGQPTKGYKTRNKSKSSRLIVKRRR